MCGALEKLLQEPSLAIFLGAAHRIPDPGSWHKDPARGRPPVKAAKRATDDLREKKESF